MSYSIPSTTNLRQFITKYADFNEDWKCFAEMSKDCDLKIDIYESEVSDRFQLAIFAEKDDSIVAAIASSFVPKDLYDVETVLSLPGPWVTLGF